MERGSFCGLRIERVLARMRIDWWSVLVGFNESVCIGWYAMIIVKTLSLFTRDVIVCPPLWLTHFVQSMCERCGVNSGNLR